MLCHIYFPSFVFICSFVLAEHLKKVAEIIPKHFDIYLAFKANQVSCIACGNNVCLTFCGLGQPGVFCPGTWVENSQCQTCSNWLSTHVDNCSWLVFFCSYQTVSEERRERPGRRNWQFLNVPVLIAQLYPTSPTGLEDTQSYRKHEQKKMYLHYFIFQG